MFYFSIIYKLFVSFCLIYIVTLPLLASNSVLNIDDILEDKPIPNTPTFYIRKGWIKLKCLPVELSIKEGQIDRVKYSCSQNSIKNSDKNHLGETNEARGTEETDRVREKIKHKVDTGVAYTVYLPLQGIKDIRRNQFIATQQIGQYGKIVDFLLPAKLYISMRPQFANDGNHSLKYKDGGSRAGLFYYHQFDNYISLMLQYEAGINSNNDKSFINLSDASNSNRRLSYISLKYNHSSIIYGKYWSPYYDIAGFTDYFMAFGASTSGAFNNNSDGSTSGTGRSDDALQLRTVIDNYHTSIQLQPSHNSSDSPDINYNYTVASSFIYKDWKGMNIGASFVYGGFDEITPQMYSIGIDGNEQSYIAGVSYTQKKIKLNAIVTYSKNHMNDDQGYYFDAFGTEIYMHYDFSDSIRIAYGHNWLMPTDDSYEQDFSIRKSILSLQYTFGKKTFDDLIYMELSLPYGRLANGDQQDINLAIGLRYLFEH